MIVLSPPSAVTGEILLLDIVKITECKIVDFAVFRQKVTEKPAQTG
jgi:hypothetical protein